jgi:lipopolysaccharide transport system permease protein
VTRVGSYRGAISERLADTAGAAPVQAREPASDDSKAVPARSPHVVHILPSRGIPRLRLNEFWLYRELLYFVVWREVKVRYKQTFFGFAWAVLQPVLLMLVFALFIGHLAKVNTGGVPYPVFAFAGLIPWTLFSQGLAGASESLVANRNLVSKVYFPRLLLPVGVAGSPTPAVILLPVFIAIAFLTVIALGLWLSALNTKYRDVRYAVPFMIQLGLFATPVAYPASLVGSGWGQTLLGLNPMAGVVEGFRWVLFGASPPGGLMAVSMAVMTVILVGGIFYFRTMERTFADVI